MIIALPEDVVQRCPGCGVRFTIFHMPGQLCHACYTDLVTGDPYTPGFEPGPRKA